MSYSISVIIHPREDKNKQHKLYVQVIYNRIKVYASTDFKVKYDQFNAGAVINHPNKSTINTILRGQKTEIESRLLEVLKIGKIPSKEKLTEIVNNKKSSSKYFKDFIDKIANDRSGSYSDGTIRHYKSIGNKIDQYAPGLKLGDIDADWLNQFEAHLRKNESANNTIWSNMKMIRAILNEAVKVGLIDESPYKQYKMPRYKQGIPEYLTEDEISKLADLMKEVDDPSKKMAGMYFLLSCYTGYRLSDAKRFNKSMIKEGKIVLRAKKNGSIVSIPIHAKLKPVVKYAVDNPLTLSEQKVREYVKALCSLKGIKKHVKFHTARHSFAMMLMAKGFTIDEVAELIGDSELITKVYARITNESLSNKILERF